MFWVRSFVCLSEIVLKTKEQFFLRFFSMYLEPGSEKKEF